MFSTSKTSLYLLISVLPAVRALQALQAPATSTNKFKYWYPWFVAEIEAALRLNCSTPYANYLQRKDPDLYLVPLGFNASSNYRAKFGYTASVASCIMDALPQSYQTNMAAAGVLLGLMPTILAVAGSHPAETSLISIRRPALGFLLALSSPAVSPLRAFEYPDIAQMLSFTNRKATAPHFLTTTVGQALVVIVEIVVVLAALFNNVTNCLDLGVQAIVSWAMDTEYLPLMWALLPGAVHVWSNICLRSSVDVNFHRSQSRSKSIAKQYIQAWAGDEFISCTQHSPTRITLKQETYWYLFSSWFLSLSTIAYYVLGTIIFSGLLFISTLDALVVLVRFLASTMACRVIVAYELAGLRRTSVVLEVPESVPEAPN